MKPGTAGQGSTNPLIRSLALQIVKDLAQKDQVGEMRALFDFVKDRVRYVRDIRGVETLHTPEAVLELGQGDCDDKAILLSSLLLSIGYPVQFVALDQGRGFMHVWLQTVAAGKLYDLDATENHPAGYRVPVKQGEKLLLWRV